jgi:glutamate carboxypeptidase
MKHTYGKMLAIQTGVKMPSVLKYLFIAIWLVTASWSAIAQGLAPKLDEAVLPLASQEAPALLETLKRLTSIDSGTGHAEGMNQLANVVEAMAKELGGTTERITPAAGVAGPNLRITFKGTGKKKVLLIAHMDTVYPAGTAAAKPFRIEGNRAIAPGIADDKGGIAIFLYAMKLLKARGYTDYAQITMLFNSDEERGSVGSRDLIRRLSSEHDVVLSGESSGEPEVIVMGTAGVGRTQAKISTTRLSLADRPIEEMADLILRSAGTAQAIQGTRMSWTLARAETPDLMRGLNANELQFATLDFQIKGKASHAGTSPHLGVNAVMEMAHLISRLSKALDEDSSIQRQWRRAGGGLIGNVIPDRAVATLEIAVPKTADLKSLMEKLQMIATSNQIKDATIDMQISSGRNAKTEDLPDATASADVRIPDMPTFDAFSKHSRSLMNTKKFPSSSIAIQDGVGFPPFNANDGGKQLAQLAQSIYTQLGGSVSLLPRTFGGTDAAWAGQSGKPVIENMGLPGGNYHSDADEYILIDRIPRRLALVAEMIRLVGP